MVRVIGRRTRSSSMWSTRCLGVFGPPVADNLETGNHWSNSSSLSAAPIYLLSCSGPKKHTNKLILLSLRVWFGRRSKMSVVITDIGTYTERWTLFPKILNTFYYGLAKTTLLSTSTAKDKGRFSKANVRRLNATWSRIEISLEVTWQGSTLLLSMDATWTQRTYPKAGLPISNTYSLTRNQQIIIPYVIKHSMVFLTRLLLTELILIFHVVTY